MNEQQLLSSPGMIAAFIAGVIATVMVIVKIVEMIIPKIWPKSRDGSSHASRNGVTKADITHLEEKMDIHHEQQGERFSRGEKKFDVLIDGQSRLSNRLTKIEAEHEMNHPRG